MKKRAILLCACLALAVGCLAGGLTAGFAETGFHVVFRSELGGFEPVTAAVEAGGKVAKPDSICRAGYEVAWYNGEKPYDFDAAVTSDLELTATWTKLETQYRDEKGNALTFDENGVSAQKMYLDEKAVPYYGLYEPGTQYHFTEEGSVFVLAAGYVALGGELDVTKAIELRFLMDPDKAWSQVSGLARFTLTMYDSYEQLFAASVDGWNPANGASLIAWGSLSDKNPTFPYHRITIGSEYTGLFDYTNAWASLTIVIGETEAESYAAFNGVKFAALDLKRSDFIDGKAVLSMTSFDAALQAKMQIRNAEAVTVTYRSATPGFTEVRKEVLVGSLAEELGAQAIEGYTFRGWFSDPRCLIPFDFERAVAGATDVYARYTDDAKEYVTLTLASQTGGFSPVVTTVEKGAATTDPGNVFGRKGFSIEWRTGDGAAYDFSAVVTADLTLTAGWTEDELELYHKMNGVVDPSYRYETVMDENGWDEEYTDFQIGDTFVDADGNEVISCYYGGAQHDSSFITQDDKTTFLLMGIGSITNLRRLDVTKRIVLDVAMNNWDFENGGFGKGDVSFSLYDNLLGALSSVNPGEDAGALVTLRTSVHPEGEFFGKFKDAESDAVTADLGFEQDKKFRIEFFISEDGTGNELKVNGVAVEGAFAGIRQSDFVGGYAYLHIRNFGCTTLYHCLVAQTSRLTLGAVQNGTVSADLAEDGIALFKQKITLTCTPAEGYQVRYARIGEKTVYPDGGNIVLYKGWEDETVTVEFARECVLTFQTNGGSAVPQQSVFEGEQFYKPTNPKREGYTFEGWFSDEACTAAFDFKSPASADVTAYAKWSENASGGGCACNGGDASALLAVLGLAAAAALKLRK